MPHRGAPVCLKCQTTESPLWTNAESLGAICLNCVNETKEIVKCELEEASSDTKPIKPKVRTTRSTRLNPFALPKCSSGSKGKGRRTLMKKTPLKAPDSTATPCTSNSVFFEGSYYQTGDIVSLIDEDDDVYYAQIRGLMSDQYCEKSAVITWLLPTKESPPPNVKFDPSTYVVGPEEELPRSLRYMEFVMHAPSDYFKSPNTPYPQVVPPKDPGYILTCLQSVQVGREIVTID